MPIVVTGQQAPIEKIEAIDIDEHGVSYVISAEHAKPYIFESLAYFAKVGTIVSYRANGATAKITARVSGPLPGQTETPIDRTTLKTTIATQSLWLNDRYLGLHPAAVKAIRQTIQDGTEYSDATGTITEAALRYGTSQALALELYDWLLRGQDSFRVFTRAITRTRTVSRNFNRKLAEDDVGKLFTSQQLVDYIKSNLPFTVPTLTVTDSETALGLAVAWQKTQADCDETAGGQGQLVESWELGKWSPHYPVKA